MSTEGFVHNHLTDAKIKQILATSKLVGEERFRAALENELKWRDENGKHFTEEMKMQHINWLHDAIGKAVCEKREFDSESFPKWHEVENWDLPPEPKEPEGRKFKHIEESGEIFEFTGFDGYYKDATYFAVTCTGAGIENVWALDNPDAALKELERFYTLVDGQIPTIIVSKKL